ncbi:helix-turn-helix domain-containing protein [Butyrivibrio sp. AE3003]|uniref:helix-turn-helix domain-containing protein n=1 Tax=Butyrivibrio sp. AE3003 TaxID=1496721 RepID=UPI00068F15EC|nr:helix-turn-helix transcriptional regulator [Butyrivibrio sp. AE3003]
MVEFGEQLRIAREKKGMTQQSLADQLFVSRQSVSRWERGERYPDLVTTKNLSRILDVSLDTLLSGKEMVKVAERNPVVENKAVNNMVIALYAVVVISFFIKIAERAMIFFIQSFKSLSESRPMNYMQGSVDERIVILRYIVYVIVFSFALYHAIKDTLTPKKIGVMMMSYFITLFLLDGIIVIDYFGSFYASMIDGAPDSMRWLRKVVVELMRATVPGGIGALASYFFFIRENNRKVWVNMFTVISIVGIIGNMLNTYHDISKARMFFPAASMVTTTARETAADFVLGIAVFVLIVYQSNVLYRKRLTAMKLQEKDKN